MTPSSLNNLKDAEKRVRIAEACGWRWGEPWGKTQARFTAPAGYRSAAWTTRDENNSIVWPLNGRTIEELRIDLIDGLPDYLNDLNAMHEAEKSLTTDEQWSAYYETMAELCDKIDCDSRSAPAFVRAEAFLATITP